MTFLRLRTVYGEFAVAKFAYVWYHIYISKHKTFGEGICQNKISTDS